MQRVLIGLSSWISCESAEIVAPLQHILDVLRLFGGSIPFLKSLAANWAFVHFVRQLVHNKCDSGEYCESKNTVVFRPKMMSESS